MSSDSPDPEWIGSGRFEERLLEEGYAASTAESYGRSVRKLLDWTEAEGLGVGELSYADLVAWARSLTSSDSYSVKTVNGHLTAIRHWMDWLGSRGVREGNPARGLKVRGERKQVPGNLLDEDELTEIYRSHPRKTLSERRDHVLTGLVVFQAMRRGELQALRPENVNLEAGTVEVPDAGRGKARTLKLRSEQIAPIMSYLRDVRPKLIEATLKAGGDRPEGLLTSMGSGTGLGNVLQRWIDRLREEHPKVKDAHQIRASRIVCWIRAEGLRRAQRKAGHRYVSSTERYRKADLEGLKASVERHHPLK